MSDVDRLAEDLKQQSKVAARLRDTFKELADGLGS